MNDTHSQSAPQSAPADHTHDPGEPWWTGGVMASLQYLNYAIASLFQWLDIPIVTPPALAAEAARLGMELGVCDPDEAPEWLAQAADHRWVAAVQRASRVRGRWAENTLWERALYEWSRPGSNR